MDLQLLLERRSSLVIASILLALQPFGTSKIWAKPTDRAAIQRSFASEGDSISVTWDGNYTGIYGKVRPGVRHCGLASGGSVTEIAARLDKAFACKPDVLSILVGAHGLEEGPDTADFLRNLFAYTDTVRKRGIKVAVATILPEYHPDNALFDATFSKRRAEANTAIREAIGVHLDAVIDFAADPVMGPDAAARDTRLYRDGVHPTDGCGMGCGGQGKLAAIYAPAMDRVLGISH